MREIKFRIWDGETLGNCLYMRLPAQSDEIMKVMQYTGRKDNNGKEICEGDIVKHRPGSNNEIGVIHFGQYEQDGSGGEYSTSTCIGFYVERNKVFPEAWEIEIGEEPYARPEYQQVSPVSDEIEVIGNIYEHPHLLPQDIESNDPAIAEAEKSH